jgi:hypothetical protein
MLDFEDDTSIARAEYMDDRVVLAAIDAGARVVVFEHVASYGLKYLAGQRRHLVSPGETPLRVGLGATCFTALLGWWGVGILDTPVTIYRNLRGGVEVTLSVRRELEERLAKRHRRAASEAALVAEAVGTDAQLAVRRRLAEVHLDRSEVEEAWSLIGDEVTRDRGPLTRDLSFLRRVMTTLHSRRVWERAARVVTVLRREHPAALSDPRDDLGRLVREVDERANLADGVEFSPPWWILPLVVLVCVAVLLVEIVLKRP